MGDGLSRRDLIKGAAVAGAAAWTAPMIISSFADTASAATTCVGTNCAAFKIASNSSINQPNLCPDCGVNSQITSLSNCITATTIGHNTYSPNGGFLIQVCGGLASDSFLKLVGVKSSNNNAGCTCVGVVCNAECDYANYPTDFVIPVTNGKAALPTTNTGCTDPSNDGTAVPAVVVLDQGACIDTTCPPAGCRFILVNSVVNINYMIVQACFPEGTVPPSC
jgi:hypothetical protein